MTTSSASTLAVTVSPGVYVPTFVLAASGPMVTLTLVGLAAASDDGAPVHVPAFVAVMTPDVAARDGLWREAEGCGARLVTAEAKARRAELVG